MLLANNKQNTQTHHVMAIFQAYLD